MKNINKYQKDWEYLISISWDKFPERQIELNEHENFFAMRRSDGTIVICGFIHNQRKSHCLGHFTYEFFMKLQELGTEYKESFEVTLMLNFSLSELDYSYLEKFPPYFKFHLVDSETGIQPQNLERSIIKNRINNIEFDEIEEQNDTCKAPPRRIDNTDYEANTMRALEGGYGEYFGF